jgi:polygalacturonase
VKLTERCDGPVVNVRDFGAKGDYETDDTAAFKRAVFALAAQEKAS